MSTAQRLKDFVRLYRLCERPPIAADSFAYSAASADDTLILALNDFCKHSENDITGLVSGATRLTHPLRVNDHVGKPISFSCQIPANGFHEDFAAFVRNTPSVHKGALPEIFYISEKDYLHGEGEVIPEIEQVAKTCRLITFFDKVITHSESQDKHIRFVLLTHDKQTLTARKQVFETRYEYNEIRELPGLEQVEEITEKDDLHSSERIVVFRNALAECLEKESDPAKRFAFLLEHFGDLKEKYKQNYETYINGFALDKFKMEVVTKSDELIQKLNTTLNDIVTKVLIVPASLLALKALGGENNITTDMMVTIAIVVISLILTFLVRHQFSNLGQIGENIEVLFKEFANREGKACEFARENKHELLRKKATIYKYLFAFIIIVWLPSLLCLAYLLKRYSFESIWDELASWITIFKSRCWECFKGAASVSDPNKAVAK